MKQGLNWGPAAHFCPTAPQAGGCILVDCNGTEHWYVGRWVCRQWWKKYSDYFYLSKSNNNALEKYSNTNKSSVFNLSRNTEVFGRKCT